MNKIVYKLTDENGCTLNNTQWGPGVTHSGTGEGELCGPGWIHYYGHPLLAVLLNPIHANFESPRLWEAQTSGKIKSDSELKFGSVSLTTLREIKLPEMTTEQRIRFAIFCALKIETNPDFVTWANRWLSGEDRTEKAAEAQCVEPAVSVVASVVASAVASAAAEAETTETTVVASAAAWAAAWAAAVVAAAWEARGVWAIEKEFSLVELAKKALEV